MKKAVILHGTDGNPSLFWMPWLKGILEKSSIQVFSPTLPENHTPNKEKYEKFLKESSWDFKDNLVVGHSSGATTALNLLSAEWFPKVNTVVLVGAFLNEKLTKSVDWYEPGQFDNLFPKDYFFDADIIKNKADNFIFVHGDNDPYCDINDARELCKKLKGTFVVIKNGHHLAGTSKVAELPQLETELHNLNLI